MVFQVAHFLFSPERTVILLRLGSIAPIELIPEEERNGAVSHRQDHQQPSPRTQVPATTATAAVRLRRRPRKGKTEATLYTIF